MLAAVGLHPTATEPATAEHWQRGNAMKFSTVTGLHSLTGAILLYCTNMTFKQY
jgi:hypothetical protein